jgi:hypothetical protein
VFVYDRAQNFLFAVEREEWGARVDTIRPVFEAARDAMGLPEITSAVVRRVWDTITPGLLDTFDAPVRWWTDVGYHAVIPLVRIRWDEVRKPVGQIGRKPLGHKGRKPVFG